MTEPLESIWHSNPIFYIVIAGFVIGLMTYRLNFLKKRDNKNKTQRDDYKKHIDPLLNILFSTTNYFHPYDSFITSIRGRKPSVRRLIQHIYTGKDTRQFYDALVNVNNNINDKDRLFRDLFENYIILRNKIKDETYPDFGACEECIDHIKLKHVKKHKETLKNSDASMWDFLFIDNYE